MYTYKNGSYTNNDMSVLKTIRFNPEEIRIIEACRGKNFSEKLKNLIKEYQKIKT